MDKYFVFEKNIRLALSIVLTFAFLSVLHIQGISSRGIFALFRLYWVRPSSCHN
jgi:hypothetical protein